MRIMLLLVIFLAACSVQPSMELKDSDEEIKEVEGRDAMMSELLGGTVSKYHQWDKTIFDKAVAEGKVIYLEFYASWCPACKKQHSELVKGFEDLSNQNVIGFRIPYKDSDTTREHEELARQYGVSYQHTKIILKDGKVVLKSPEAWDSTRFMNELKKVEA